MSIEPNEREICSQLKSIDQDIEYISAELKILEARLAPTIPTYPDLGADVIDGDTEVEVEVEPIEYRSEIANTLNTFGYSLRAIRRRLAYLHENTEI